MAHYSFKTDSYVIACVVSIQITEVYGVDISSLAGRWGCRR